MLAAIVAAVIVGGGMFLIAPELVMENPYVFPIIAMLSWIHAQKPPEDVPPQLQPTEPTPLFQDKFDTATDGGVIYTASAFTHWKYRRLGFSALVAFFTDRRSYVLMAVFSSPALVVLIGEPIGDDKLRLAATLMAALFAFQCVAAALLLILFPLISHALRLVVRVALR